MNIHLTAAFIPGKVNTAIETATKTCHINGEWMLLPKKFSIGIGNTEAYTLIYLQHKLIDNLVIRQCRQCST